MRVARSILAGVTCFAAQFSGVLEVQAAITQVSSPAELFGPLIVENFDGPTAAPGVEFSTASGLGATRSPATNTSSGVTTSQPNGLLARQSDDPMTMVFDVPVKSVGMFFGNDDIRSSTGFSAFVDIFGPSCPGCGDFLGTIEVVANMNDFVDQFIGFNSTSPVTNIQLRYGDATGVNAPVRPFIDDFQFSPIPEPSSLVVAMLAAVSASLFLRRFFGPGVAQRGGAVEDGAAAF